MDEETHFKQANIPIRQVVSRPKKSNGHAVVSLLLLVPEHAAAGTPLSLCNVMALPECFSLALIFWASLAGHTKVLTTTA